MNASTREFYADKASSALRHTDEETRKHNNGVKAHVIDRALAIVARYTKRVGVLELACGEGQDAMKWVHPAREAGMTIHLTAIDILQECVERARDRYERLDKTVFEYVMAVKGDMCMALPRSITAHIVSCQLAVHYAFASQESMVGFLSNIRQSGAIVCAFSFTDGAAVVRAARNTASKSFIRPHFDPRAVTSPYGNKYEFRLGEHWIEEYLVSAGVLEALMAGIGFRLAEWSTFGTVGINGKRMENDATKHDLATMVRLLTKTEAISDALPPYFYTYQLFYRDAQ